MSKQSWNKNKESIGVQSCKFNKKAWRSKVKRIKFEDWEQTQK